MIQGTSTALHPVLILMAGIIGAVSLPGNAPSAGTVQPGTTDDFSAAYATPQDIVEGNRLAEASCARCHGANGISTAKGVPHLASQRPVYLHLELLAYKSGARGNDMMDGAVKFLSDEALVKVAAYYASLDPPQPAPTATTAAAPARPDPVSAGKAAAAGCAGCHGETGVSKIPGMPSLVGLEPGYLVAAMKAYKDGQREHDMMKSLLTAVSDANLNDIALYYALQKPARAQTPAPGDQAAGKAAAAACAACHGDQGVSGNPANPSLAGQDAQYLAAALRAYKTGSRSEQIMKGLAGSLDDRAIRDLAAYYATQQPRPPKVSKPVSSAEWMQKCDRCHGINGNSTDPRIPGIAAQRVDYLLRVLQDYRTGARKSPAMAAMSTGLTEADVEDLAAHYAGQKARAVVYVVLPAAK